jgi:flagellar motor component MotA
MEKLTDKHIKTQALQHLLIHYEKKYDKYKKLDRDDIIKNLELYIAKIRRTLIQVLEEEQENENKPIKFY